MTATRPAILDEACINALPDQWMLLHADLLMCCELEQLVMLSAAAAEVPRFEALLEPFSKVQAWRERVKAATQPHFGTVSKFLYTVAERMSKASAQSKM